MSNGTRNLIAAAITVLLAASSFAAGYLANDLIDLHAGTARGAGDEEEFAILWEAWSWVESSYIGETYR